MLIIKNINFYLWCKLLFFAIKLSVLIKNIQLNKQILYTYTLIYKTK